MESSKKETDLDLEQGQILFSYEREGRQHGFECWLVGGGSWEYMGFIF